MSLQHAEHAFSRIPNGNFANGVSHWSSPALLVTERLTIESNTTVGVPSRVLRMRKTTWVDIPYRDLAVYPAVVDFNQLAFEPYALNEYLAIGSAKYSPAGSSLFPFSTADNTVVVAPGDIVYVDDYRLDEYSGEYRFLRGLDRERAILQAPAGLPVVAKGGDSTAFYARGPSDATDLFRVIFDRDIRLLGVSTDDFIACSTPRLSGRISSFSLDGKVANIWSSTVRGHVLPLSTGGAQVPLGLNWIIRPHFTANIRRRLPACLYDLTLAFSMRNDSLLDANDVYLDLFSEIGALIETMRPQFIDPADSNKHYIAKGIPGNIYTRYVYRFLEERAEPHYGSARLRFGNPLPAGDTRIADVVMFRGDYTQQMRTYGGSGQTFDYLEKFIGDEAEIIPRGTIVAYVGGSVCPSGWARVEGVGKLKPADLTMTKPEDLFLSFKPFSFLSSCDFKIRDGLIDGSEPRTQITYKLAYGEMLRTDIRAGHTLDFYFSATQRSVYALISSAGREMPVDPYADGAQQNIYYTIELVGDYEKLCKAAAEASGTLRVWRTGVIAHVQGAPDLPSAWKNAGGYAALGEDHTHVLQKSSDLEQGNVIWSSREVGSGASIPHVVIRNRYDNHSHLPLRTASVIPKVRPVLLCQKI